MSDEWPVNPPEPTDRHQYLRPNQLPVRKCIHCDDTLEAGDDGNYFSHVSSCPQRDSTTNIRFPNGSFGLVVPEQSGYVWTAKTGGFACSNVSIQGTLLPLGTVESHNFDVDGPAIDGDFSTFPNPQKARRLYMKGVQASIDYEYGGVDLGAKLVSETLDGVYADSEDVRGAKSETRSERIAAVWEEIDEALPFSYERVAAPVGRPVTQEGLRWIDVQADTQQDPVFERDWITALIERESPVALYYPNSD